MSRIVARMRGEVSALDLEVYGQAGATLVYEELQRATELQARLAADGVEPRATPPHLAAQLLATWNAYVLQTLGERMLDADYSANPATAGFVPPLTLEQVQAFYDEVEEWVATARQAADNPGYRVTDQAVLPAALPPWARADTCPPAHLHGLAAACRAVRDRAELTVADFERVTSEAHRGDVDRLRQLYAAGVTAVDYAESLLASGRGRRGEEPTDDLHLAIEERLQRAAEIFFQVGQLAAMPALFDERRAKDAGPPAGPDGVTIDPWCLTDPRARGRWRRDAEARAAIETMWRRDPNPGKTLRIQEEIDAALRAGDIEYATDDADRPLPSFQQCPWPAIYQAVREVRIKHRVIEPGQQFTLEIHFGDVPRGESYSRHIVVGEFVADGEVRYRG